MAAYRSVWGRAAVPRLSRRRALAVAGGSLGATAFAAACGGDDKKDAESGAATGGTTGGAQATQAAPEQPRTGGIVNLRLQTDPAPLDIHQVTTYTGVWPTAPCFNQLVQFDPTKQATTPENLVSDLAEKWEQPDPSTVVFTLKKGVKFHDGSDFTSDDPKVQLDWIRRPPQGKTSARAGTLATIDTIETPDPNTLRIRLKRPTASMLVNLASHYFAIGQAKDIIANGEVGPRLIGTGPFKLKQYQRANLLELEKNPAYHVQGRPYLDGIRSYILPDFTTAMTNLLAGQYHMWYDSLTKPSDLDRIKQEAGDKFDTEPVASTLRDPVFMNARRKPYDDPRVRQAISLSIDRDAGIKVIKGGAGRRGGYMDPKGAWAISEGDLKKFEGYDKPNIEKAKQLLSAAGVTSLEAVSYSRTDFKDLAEFTKDQLAKIGINLKLTLGDTGSTQPIVQRGDYDIAPWLIFPNVDDPDTVFGEISTSTATRNWSAVFDPEIDALFEKQSQTLDTSERKKIVQDLERRALSQYQVATILFEDLLFAKAKVLRNFVFQDSLYTNRRLENAWLRQ